MTRRRKITLVAIAVASVLVAVGTVVVAKRDRSSTLSVASTVPRTTVRTSTTEPQPATTSTSTSAAGLASPTTQPPASRPRPAVATTTSAMPSRFPPDVQPGVVPPGRDADDPCFGPSVTPIAVAGTRSPDGRLWIALQHGSVGISDDRGTTWTWHCEVVRADGLTIAPRTLVAWDATNALAWGRRRNGQTVLLRTQDAGATWSALDLADIAGIDIASVDTVYAWRSQTGSSPSTSATLLKLATRTGQWQPVEARGLPGAPSAVAFVDDAYGWAFGPDSSQENRTWLAATADGGATWQRLQDPAFHITGIAPGDASRGCVLRRQDARCTEDSGRTWEDSGVDVAMTHIAAIDAHRTIVAGSGGQVRFLADGKVSGGTTIDTAENHIRFLSVEWGRFITTNSWDGCFELEKGDFLEPRPLGPSNSSQPAC